MDEEIIKQKIEELEKQAEPTKEEKSDEKHEPPEKSEPPDLPEKTEKPDNTAKLNERISELENELSRCRVENVLHEQAAALGIETSAVSYIAKLADLSDAVDGSGAPDVGKIKAAVEKVLADIPALKAVKNDSKGFIPIGADSTASVEKLPREDTKLRRAFGL